VSRNWKSRIVINCAGLFSDKIAALAGIDILKEGYKLYYFKGEFYSITPEKARSIGRRLIYPMNDARGLVGNSHGFRPLRPSEAGA